MSDIISKQQMYPMLAAGMFGNANPAWDNLATWLTRDILRDHPLWGLRHRALSNFPGSKLNVPTEEVMLRVGRDFGNENYNISPMIPTGILWEGNVYDHPVYGLLVSGTLRPMSGTWRQHMLRPQEWTGSAALQLLRQTLNDNSHDDLMRLVERYPNHVYEMTVLDHTYGTVPGRNAVIWEVRNY